MHAIAHGGADHTSASRRALRVAFAALLAVLSLPVLAAPARAERTVTVEPATNLDPQGHKVRVRGSGFDSEAGIYVAWCVVPPKGQKPTPCGGGDDRTGESGNSAWISTNPAIGATLAKPYGPGGSFDVEILVSRRIGEIDCFVKACAVTTRNDHENTDDRSQDTFTPVRFRGQVETTVPSGGSQSSAGPAGSSSPASTAKTNSSSRPSVTTGADAESPTSELTGDDAPSTAIDADSTVTDDDGRSSRSVLAQESAARREGMGGDGGSGRALALVAVPMLGGASLLLFRLRRPGITP